MAPNQTTLDQHLDGKAQLNTLTSVVKKLQAFKSDEASRKRDMGFLSGNDKTQVLRSNKRSSALLKNSPYCLKDSKITRKEPFGLQSHDKSDRSGSTEARSFTGTQKSSATTACTSQASHAFSQICSQPSTAVKNKNR